MRVLSRSKKAAARLTGVLAVDLDDDRVALTATRADRRDADAATAATELVDERADDAGARSADRVAERDRPAVDVDVVLFDAEHAHRVEGDRGEGLVDLPEVDVLGALADLLQRLLGGVGRGFRQVGEVVGDRAVGEHASQRRAAFLLRPLGGGDDYRPSPVVDPRRVAGGVGGVLATDRPQAGERLDRGLGTDRLVGLDRVLALARLDRHTGDLVGQAAGVGRLGGQSVGALGEAVHVGAGDLQLVGDLARLVDHLLLGEGVGEAVVDHRVDRLDVPHPEAGAGARQQVGRLAHRLHAAGDRDLRVAGADRQVGDAERAHPRGADLVDRLGGHLLRDAALDLGLARGDLPLAGLQDLAEDDLLDLAGIDAGALQGRLDHVAAEV